MNGAPPENPRNILRAMRVFTIAIVIGTTGFAPLILLVTITGGSSDYPFHPYFATIFALAAAVAVICTLIARRQFASALAVAKDSLNPLTDKLKQYQGALTRYMALCEGPALLSSILVFLSGDYYYFAITGVMVATMMLKWPTATKLVRELELDASEQQELE